MGNETTTLKTKAMVTLTTLIWIAGLLAAGSDGPLMPYINIGGGFVFLGASILLGRLLPKLSQENTVGAARPIPNINPRPLQQVVASRQTKRALRKRPVISGLRGQRLHPRFARELGVV
ncbi:MAG: hypothetical protein MI802_01345 [Desulfobacterales bacterium]|nr:hypothetical protein [Desulfobacterales bacterium]